MKKDNVVKFFIFSITIFVMFFVSIPKRISTMKSGEKKPFRYLFFQQVNPLCTIAPMLNRYRLQALKQFDKSPGQNFSEQALNSHMFALTHRQWFGESHLYLFTWRKFLIDFMHSEVGKIYIRDAANNGLVTPHFYDQNGAWLCQGGEAASGKYPYFFADTTFYGNIDAGPEFLIPLVNPHFCDPQPDYPNEPICAYINKDTQEDSGWLIYNKNTKTFEPFSYIKLQNNPEFLSIKASILPRENTLDTEIIFNHTSMTRGMLGFKATILPHQDWSEGFEGKMPYCLGILKMMFLTLGIDNDNQIIAEGTTEYKVHTTIRELIQADRENNPWSDKFFEKEYFIQYALAEIFKNNQELYNDAKKVVDFAGVGYWPTYEDITTGRLVIYKDNHGTPYDRNEIIKYLPGRHQALAYFFTGALRYLWYGAASKDAIALYKALGAYDSNHPYISRLALWWTGFNFSKLKSNALKKIDGISFLSVWDNIKRELQLRYPNIQDWVSFDDHGWIISFDPELIGMQREVAYQKSCDYNFLDRLGLAGIESWWGRELETFYKR